MTTETRSTMTRNAPLVLLVFVGALLVVLGMTAISYAARGAVPVVELVPAPPPYTSPEQADGAGDPWRTGAPVAAIMVGVAAFAIIAGRRDPRRAWLWGAVAGAVLLALDVLRTGVTPNIEMLLASGAVLSAGALPGFVGAPRGGRTRARTERGSALAPVLVWLASAGLLLVGAGLAGSCSSARQHASASASYVVDCTTATARAHAAEYGALLEGVILAATAPGGEVAFAPVRAAAVGFGLETGGCALAATVARLLEPAPSARGAPQILPHAPAAASLRAGWDALRREQLGGRRFAVGGGVL